MTDEALSDALLRAVYQTYEWWVFGAPEARPSAPTDAIHAAVMAALRERLPVALRETKTVGWIAGRYGRFNDAYYERLAAAIIGEP